MFSGLFIAFMGAGYIMRVRFVKGGRSEDRDSDFGKV
jgi:hypothetical protein